MGRTIVPGGDGGGHDLVTLFCSFATLVLGMWFCGFLFPEPLEFGLLLSEGFGKALSCWPWTCGLCLALGFWLWSFFLLGFATTARHEAVGLSCRILGLSSCRVHGRVPWFVLVWTLLCRIGEASVPGPPAGPDVGLGFAAGQGTADDRFSGEESRDDSTWSIGIFNPAGLAGKAHLVPTDTDIWAVSETHLSRKSAKTFCSLLSKSRSPYRLLTGHPVPPRHACWL